MPTVAFFESTIAVVLTVIVIGAGVETTRTRDTTEYLIKILDQYIDEGRLVSDKESTIMEGFLSSEYARYVGGRAFYEVLFEAQSFAKKNHAVNAIRINEAYNHGDLNLYFLGYDQDTYGILKANSIKTAISLPHSRIVVINSDFLKELFKSKITVGRSASSLMIDFVQAQLEGSNSGVLTVDDVVQTYNMFIGIYVVLHEVGHVLLGHGVNSVDHSDLQKESEADEFYVQLMTNMLRRPVPTPWGDDFRYIFYADLVDSLHTYASYTTLKELGKQSTELIFGNEPIRLKQFYFSRHPHMLERICRLFSFLRQAPQPLLIPQISQPNLLSHDVWRTPRAYQGFCERISVRRTIWP